MGGIKVVDYKKLYHKLFNDITDVIDFLQKSQIDVEEMYLSMGDEDEENKKSEKVVRLAD